MGIGMKYLVPDQVKPSFVIFDIWALWTERQSARMSKTTSDGLTRSGTRCFIAVPIWQQWASKCLKVLIVKYDLMAICAHMYQVSTTHHV